jgi:hypothetical protein
VRRHRTPLSPLSGGLGDTGRYAVADVGLLSPATFLVAVKALLEHALGRKLGGYPDPSLPTFGSRAHNAKPK